MIKEKMLWRALFSLRDTYRGAVSEPHTSDRTFWTARRKSCLDRITAHYNPSCGAVFRHFPSQLPFAPSEITELGFCLWIWFDFRALLSVPPLLSISLFSSLASHVTLTVIQTFVAKTRLPTQVTRTQLSYVERRSWNVPVDHEVIKLLVETKQWDVSN